MAVADVQSLPVNPSYTAGAGVGCVVSLFRLTNPALGTVATAPNATRTAMMAVRISGHVSTASLTEVVGSSMLAVTSEVSPAMIAPRMDFQNADICVLPCLAIKSDSQNVKLSRYVTGPGIVCLGRNRAV